MKYTFFRNGAEITAYDIGGYACPVYPAFTAKAREYYEGDDCIRIWAIQSEDEEAPALFAITFSGGYAEARAELRSGEYSTEQELNERIEELADAPSIDE